MGNTCLRRWGLLGLTPLTWVIALGLIATLSSCPGPAPIDGKSIDVGGYSIFYRLREHDGDAPPIIMMSGLNDNLRVWTKVQNLVDFATTVSYDRGGVGWSDPGEEPRTGGMIVEELHNFLTALDLEPPYILCAHSFGGLFARLYAYTYPNEIAGILLIDTTHEDRYDRQALALKATSVQMVQIQEVLLESVMASSGALGEYVNQNNTFAEVRSKRRLPDVPLLLLSEDFHEFDYLAADQGNKTYELEREMDEDQAALVPRGVWEVVQGAGHEIQKQAPEAVVDGLKRLVAGW